MVEVALLHSFVIFRDVGRCIHSRKAGDEPKRSVGADYGVLFVPAGSDVELVVGVLLQMWIPLRSEAHLGFVYPV
jgi:hypothetical protein